MIASALGWKLERVTDDIKPMIADQTVASELLAVDPGYVSGIVQDGVGYVKGEPRIRLHLEAYMGAPESYDSVLIEGSPRISSKIDGGVHGVDGRQLHSRSDRSRAGFQNNARFAAAVIQWVDDRCNVSARQQKPHALQQ
jgi:hypothetical protein